MELEKKRMEVEGQRMNTQESNAIKLEVQNVANQGKAIAQHISNQGKTTTNSLNN
jgi:hypothetical protein